MALADLEGMPPVLQVAQLGTQAGEPIVDGAYALVEPCAQQAGQEGIERAGFPPAIHVRFAQSQRAVGQHARIEIIVANPDIPGPFAVDPDIGQGEQLRDTVLERGWFHFVSNRQAAAGNRIKVLSACESMGPARRGFDGRYVI